MADQTGVKLAGVMCPIGRARPPHDLDELRRIMRDVILTPATCEEIRRADKPRTRLVNLLVQAMPQQGPHCFAAASLLTLLINGKFDDEIGAALSGVRIRK